MPEPFSPIFAVGLALVLPPVLALATRGGTTCDGNPSDAKLLCHVTGTEFERPDMVWSAQDGPDGGPAVRFFARLVDRQNWGSVVGSSCG